MAREANGVPLSVSLTCVRAYHLGQAVLAEQTFKCRNDLLEVDAVKRFAGQNLATKMVCDRQRITHSPISEAKLTFEISAPDLIGATALGQPVWDRH